MRGKRESLVLLCVDWIDRVSVRFFEISNFLIGSGINLSDVFCIDRDKGLYRAKFASDEVRSNILNCAKRLKGSEYDGIYINRDLTYIQHQELFARRTGARRESQGTGSLGGPDSNVNLN